jgi:hypothetical protein
MPAVVKTQPWQGSNSVQISRAKRRFRRQATQNPTHFPPSRLPHCRMASLSNDVQAQLLKLADQTGFVR